MFQIIEKLNRSFIFTLIFSLLPLSSLAGSSASVAAVTELISLSYNSLPGNGSSGIPVISADGRFVAFGSEATNLVIGDTNGKYDGFIYDRQNKTTELVSISSLGEQADDGSQVLSISADGRYVAFYSEASNLVSGDTNGTFDVFLRDWQSGLTEMISVSSTGEQGNLGSVFMSVSGDGRLVAFSADSTNLVNGDTNDSFDIFVRDRQLGTTERVSVSSSGGQGNYDSQHPSISADGRYVAFGSASTNLVSGDTNGQFDTFVHDRQTGITELISVSSSGIQANNGSGENSISGDGRYVAFLSSASNLVIGDTNNVEDVFVRDRYSGTTERVSVSSTGEQGNDYSRPPFISVDGRYVSFYSNASNLVSGDSNGVWDVFVRDRMTGNTERISVSSTGAQGNGFSAWPSMSDNGRYVAFYSEASNLVNGDTNGYLDVFVRDRFGTDPPPTKEPWLIMYYLAGDNDLYAYQKRLLGILQEYVKESPFNISVMFDGASDNDSRYYYIADNIKFAVKGELNSGNPDTLVEFVDWSLTMFPVENVALVINDHSNLTGIARDESQGYSIIEIKELGGALQEIHDKWGKIDILFLESCLLATTEAGYEFKDYVDYFVASENLIWLATPPNYLNEIDNSTSPEDLAVNIATNYHEMRSDFPHTISVAKLSSLPNLVEKVSILSDLLKIKMSGIGDTLIRLQILNNVQRFSSNIPVCSIDLLDESIDLYDFARLVKEKTDDNELKNAAQSVMEAIEDDPILANRYIIKNFPFSGTVPENARECSGKNWDLSNSHGVAIFFAKPESKRSWYNGNTFSFALGTDWELYTLKQRDYLAETIQWGPMLVEYVNTVYPEATDDPSFPPIVPPLVSDLEIGAFLPVIMNR